MAHEAVIAKNMDLLVREVREQNRVLRRIASALEQKQFDEFDAPPVGTAIQNMRGCVMLNVADFNELVRDSDEGEEDDRS